MRHQKHRLRLGRPSASRKALMRNMATALLTHERIVTTVPKAKALRKEVEPLITLGKKGDLPARRRALQILPNKKIVQKLFDEIAPQFADRNGGYTRILKLTHRHGDAAPMALLELVGFVEKQRAAAEAKAAEETKGKKGLRQRLKDKVKGVKKEVSETVEASEASDPKVEAAAEAEVVEEDTEKKEEE